MAAAVSEEEMAALRIFYDDEDLKVITPTRFPQPIFTVVNNISLVTANEIREMNAHSMTEVLNRVPGVFLSSSQDFCDDSVLNIQQSADLHVLLLLDGMPWNYLSNGAFTTSTIPVGIIERIEIIKGPASSVWGSSLGGVINVITKSPTKKAQPEGFVTTSYGEGNSADYKAGISGTADRLGYFLFAGHQESDGLLYSRYHDNNSLFSKISLTGSRHVKMGMSIGYSEPSRSYGEGFPGGDTMLTTAEQRAFFVNGFMNLHFSRHFGFELSAYTFKQKYDGLSLSLDESYGTVGSLFQSQLYDEKAHGVSGKFSWRKKWESGIGTILVLGSDYKNGELDQTLQHGEVYQGYGALPMFRTSPDTEAWSVYMNVTMNVGWDFSLVSGIRYDYDDISGSFVSPSIGFTCEIGDGTMLRGTAARGFTSPPLIYKSGGALWLDPNPDLEPEKVGSIQVGAETVSIPYVWVKATAFYHDLENAFSRETTAAGNNIYVNKGHIRRKGFEIEVETLPVYHLSFSAGVAYVDISPGDDTGADETYTWDIGIQYDHEKFFKARLLGRYYWGDWHLPWFESSYKDFIWDVHLSKEISSKGNISAELFMSVRNLFNGDQHDDLLREIPERWVEGGIRFEF